MEEMQGKGDDSSQVKHLKKTAPNWGTSPPALAVLVPPPTHGGGCNSCTASCAPLQYKITLEVGVGGLMPFGTAVIL